MTATVVAFRPNFASAKKPRKQPGVLTLKALPGAGKSMDVQSGHFMGTLTVGEHVVKADDGHLLGLAAFVMGASSVKVHMPSFKEDEPLRLRSNAHFHSVKVETLSYDKAGRKRHEAWFIKRFGSGFYTGSNGARAQLGLIEHWEKKSLPKVLALVPGEAQLFTRFSRAAAYDDQGHPLSAGAIAREAHDKRVMDAFRAAAEAPSEPSVDWCRVVRAEEPHGPVATGQDDAA